MRCASRDRFCSGAACESVGSSGGLIRAFRPSSSIWRSLWVYLNLKQRLGQAKAFEIMRVTILTGGVAQWNLAYQTVEKARSFENLCDLELEVNKTEPTRWNTLEVVDRTDRRFEVKVTRCLYHELARSLGIPEITPVICQIDNAAFNAHLSRTP